jgi:ribosomal protein S18 acetylase RimI-like enzyme
MDIRRMAPHELDEVIRVWHETSADTYGFLEAERGRTLEDRARFFRERILPVNDLWVAVRAGRVVGLLALRAGYVDRLYVLPAEQRGGVGSALLAQARHLSPAGLRLHTHQANTKARAFYERAGFRTVRLGLSPPPESAPDVEYAWP